MDIKDQKESDDLFMAVATILANSHNIETRRVIRRYYLREVPKALNTLRLAGFDIISHRELDRLRDAELELHLSVANESHAAETERLKARVAELEAALGMAERHIIGMYRGACPAANTDDGNRFAETDEAVVAIRTALKDKTS